MRPQETDVYEAFAVADTYDSGGMWHRDIHGMGHAHVQGAGVNHVTLAIPACTDT